MEDRSVPRASKYPLKTDSTGDDEVREKGIWFVLFC